MNTSRKAIESSRFTKQKPRDVKEMTAEIRHNKLFQLSEERLIFKDREAAVEVYSSPKKPADCTRLKHAL